MVNAMGHPPGGHAKEDARFNLPTETSTIKNSEKFEWATLSVRTRLSGGGAKAARKTQEQFGQEYEKKIAEAAAKAWVKQISIGAVPAQIDSGR